MNNLGEIRKKYDIDTFTLSDILGLKSASNIAKYYNKKISELTIEQLIRLHDITKAAYNTLLGDTIFTPNNIEDSQPIISILDNENEYNRLLDRLKKDLNK